MCKKWLDLTPTWPRQEALSLTTRSCHVGVARPRTPSRQPPTTSQHQRRPRTGARTRHQLLGVGPGGRRACILRHPPDSTMRPMIPCLAAGDAAVQIRYARRPIQDTGGRPWRAATCKRNQRFLCKFGRSSKPSGRDQCFPEQNRLPGEQSSGSTRVCSRTPSMDSGPQASIFDWYLQPNMVNSYRLTVRKSNKYLPR